MSYTTSHAMGVRLQVAKLLNLPWTQVTNTTLNEALSIQAGVAPDNGATPNMAYLAIGNGGHKNAVTSDGIPYVDPIQHDPESTGLVNQTPFVLRTTGDDLTTSERTNYALRGTLTINGVSYIAYYLRKLDLSSTTIQMLVSTTVDGVTTTTPWVPSGANLHPSLPATDTTGAVTANGSKIICQAVVTVALSANDVTELMNVANILYGTTNLAIVSEMALVAAVDKLISASVSGGGTISYTEAIGAIICSSDSTYYYMPGLNQGTTLTFNVGGGESLYGLTAGVTSTTSTTGSTSTSSNVSNGT